MTDPLATMAQVRRLEHAGRIADALSLITPFAASAREGDDVLAAIDATMNEAMLCTRLGDVEIALARASWALGTACDPRNRARLSSRSAAWKITMAFYAWCDAARSHAIVGYDAIAAVVRQAEAFLESTGHGEWRSGVLAEHAAILTARERHVDAIPLLREAAALKRRFPDAPGMTLETLLRDLGRALDHGGEPEEAAVVLRELLAVPALPPIDQLASHCYLGHNALRRGASDEALRCAVAAIAVAETMEDRQRIPAYGLAVDARLAVGDGAGARVAADRILELARRVGGPKALFNAIQDNFEVALFEGAFERADEWLAELDARADELDARVGAPEHRGRVDERRARLARARA